MYACPFNWRHHLAELRAYGLCMVQSWELGSTMLCTVWMQEQRASKAPAASIGTSHVLFCHLFCINKSEAAEAPWQGPQRPAHAPTGGSNMPHRRQRSSPPLPHPPTTIWIWSHPLRQAVLAAATWQHVQPALWSLDQQGPPPSGGGPASRMLLLHQGWVCSSGRVSGQAKGSLQCSGISLSSAAGAAGPDRRA